MFIAQYIARVVPIDKSNYAFVPTQFLNTLSPSFSSGAACRGKLRAGGAAAMPLDASMADFWDDMPLLGEDTGSEGEHEGLAAVSVTFGGPREPRQPGARFGHASVQTSKVNAAGKRESNSQRQLNDEILWQQQRDEVQQ